MKMIRITLFVVFGFLSSSVTASNLNAYENLFSQHEMSVVSVIVKRDPADVAQIQPFPFMIPGNPFGSLPESPQNPQYQPEQAGQGSGFIVDKQGYIVTNNHVVDGAKSIVVSFDDGHFYPAKIVGQDAGTDVALLKIDPPANVQLQPLQWGDSDSLQPGAPIAAIGTPEGLYNSITSGILSAKDRMGTQYASYLQLDLALNPGNSGGPLLDLNGNVVGVNVAIGSNTGMYAGISYALPSNIVKNVVKQLRHNGHVKRAMLGVSIVPLSPELASAFGLTTTQGALVNEVVPGSPAQKAGIRNGDIILCFNQTKVKKVYDLPIAVGQATVGTNASVEVWREKKKMTVSMRLQEDPNKVRQRSAKHDSPSSSVKPALSSNEILGMTLHETKLGLVIENLKPEMQIQYGLQPGDIIAAVGSDPVKTIDQLKSYLSEYEDNDYIALKVTRQTGGQESANSQFYVAIPSKQTVG